MAGGVGQSRLRMWELEWMQGGRGVVESLEDEAILGQSFAFLKPGWGQTPLISSILETAGAKRPEPKIVPLWGDGWVDLPGLSMRQRSIPCWEIGGIWTEKRCIRAGEVVRAVVYAPWAAQQAVGVSLSQNGQGLGSQEIPIDELGMGTITLEGLPPGTFRLELDGHTAQADFIVALGRKEAVKGTWIQQYIQEAGLGRQVFVFVLQLESFGAPLRGEVGLNLLDLGRTPNWPVSGNVFRTDGAGRVAGELQIAGIGPFALEIQSLADDERRTLLMIPLEHEGIEENPSFCINPLSENGNWRWGDGKEASSFGFVEEPDKRSSRPPLTYVGFREGHAILKAEAFISEPGAVVMDPFRGEHEFLHLAQLSAGEEWELPLGGAFGMVVLAGFVGGRAWEGWMCVVTPTQASFAVSVAERVEPGAAFSLSIETGLEREVPVYLVVREKDEEDVGAWGPAVSLRDELLKTVSEMALDFPSMPLANIKSMPTSLAVEGGQPEALEGEAAVEFPDGWQPPMPEREHFDQVYYSEIVRVSGKRTIQLQAPDEPSELHLEAVMLDEGAWCYLHEELEVSAKTFAELLLPPFAHAEDGSVGEVIIVTELPRLRVGLWCNAQPVECWMGSKKIVGDIWLEESVGELSFSISPGHYVLKLFDGEGEVLESVETRVGDWGVLSAIHHQLRLLGKGAGLSTSVAQVEQIVPLGGIEPWTREVARFLALLPSGNCEQEAARVSAAAAWLQCASHREDAERAMQFLKSGLERLEALKLPRHGFRMAPDGEHDPVWGKEAVLHLWEAELPVSLGAGSPFSIWFRDIRALADDAAQGYRLHLTPTRIQSCRDAYRVYFLDDLEARRQEALWECQKRLVEEGVFLKVWGESAVQSRQESCYAAAVLLLSDDAEVVDKGIKTANGVFAQMREKGRLYATQDNIALLALLRSCALLLERAQPEILVAGETSAWEDVLEEAALDELQMVDGSGVFAVSKRVTESLTQFQKTVPMEVAMIPHQGPREPLKEAEVGARVSVLVRFPEGTREGDLIELYLPRALMCLGGDFGNELISFVLQPCKQIELPLAAIAPTEGIEGDVGPQRWGVRLRNLYQEERGAADFQQQITIWPYGKRPRGIRGQISQGWRKIFG